MHSRRGWRTGSSLGLAVGLLLAAASPLSVAFAAECEDMAAAGAGADVPERCPGLWSSCCDYGPLSPRVGGDAAAKARVLAGNFSSGPVVMAAPIDLGSGPPPKVSSLPRSEHGPPALPPKGSVTVLRL